MWAVIKRRILKVRRRRSPEQARTELLDAAESLFRDAPPDQLGLKAVATEAGVSHALITHYFGTYDGLVEAVFERRTRSLRERVIERLAAGGVTEAGELVDLLFTTFEDPVHVRLMTWMIASGRNTAALTLRDRGLSFVAESVARALDPAPTAELREKIEYSLIVTVASAFGYSAMKQSLASSVGKLPTAAVDRDDRRTLTEMLQVYLLR
ncbi:MAG TPA: TetR/AcrR family transcriptional regulator [Kofleriaceae bacterium]